LISGQTRGWLAACISYASPRQETAITAGQILPHPATAEGDNDMSRPYDMGQPDPEPSAPPVDDLGVTRDDWHDLLVAYTYGTIEPHEGSVEAEAFRRINEYNRREIRRLAGQEAQEEAWHRYATRPFPGGPLTASLTFLEAAELSGKLSRGSSAAWDALSGTHWRTDAYLSLTQTAREIDDAYQDVKAETLISGARHLYDSDDTFKRRAEREPRRIPDPTLFDHPAQPSIETADTAPEAELVRQSPVGA
jgi:hypothetical protein